MKWLNFKQKLVIFRQTETVLIEHIILHFVDQ